MRKLHSFSPSLVIISYFLLLAIGIIEVWSSSYYFAFKRFNQTDFFLNRQLIFVFLSVLTAFFVSLINYKFWQKTSVLWVGLSLFFLFVLHFVGVDIRGATRWMKLGPFMFEPSGLAEFGLLVYIANFISKKFEYRDDVSKGVIPVSFVVGLFVILIALQPDIGTAFLMFIVFLSMIYVFGYKFKYILGLLFPSLIVFAMIIYSNPQRLQRIVNKYVRHEVNYQVKHALVAFGSGGLFGHGVARGEYKSLFVPDSYNDFIIAGIGEDFGFIGVFVVVILLSVIIFSIFMLSSKCKDRFGSALSFGIGLFFSYQALINLFTVLNIIPPKGITMPFLSYGGTSLVINGALVGLVLAIYRRCPFYGEKG